MTKNTPRIFISLLLMLLCIGILPVSAFASDGDYPDDALPTAESSAADTQETKQIGTVTTNGGLVPISSISVRLPSGVSHVGIYVGNNMMIHCGDPISYANLNSNYWQSHFYRYGRLP